MQADQQPPWVQGAALLPHQIQACAWLRSMWLQRRAAVLADDQGLGKTASAAAYIGSVLQEFKAHAPVLVVAPLATLSFWEGRWLAGALG
jgi:SNF2 family DNA or RNA helicase